MLKSLNKGNILTFILMNFFYFDAQKNRKLIFKIVYKLIFSRIFQGLLGNYDNNYNKKLYKPPYAIWTASGWYLTTPKIGLNRHRVTTTVSVIMINWKLN